MIFEVTVVIMVSKHHVHSGFRSDRSNNGGYGMSSTTAQYYSLCTFPMYTFRKNKVHFQRRYL